MKTKPPPTEGEKWDLKKCIANRQLTIKWLWNQEKTEIDKRLMVQRQLDLLEIDLEVLLSTTRKEERERVVNLITTVMKEYANMPLDKRPNAFDYLFRLQTLLSKEKDV